MTVVAALGEMFPGRALRSEAGEAGSGQGWRLGPVDLDAGVVEVVRTGPEHGPEGGGDDPDDRPPTVPPTG